MQAEELSGDTSINMAFCGETPKSVNFEVLSIKNRELLNQIDLVMSGRFHVKSDNSIIA